MYHLDSTHDMSYDARNRYRSKSDAAVCAKSVMSEALNILHIGSQYFKPVPW